LPLVVALDQLRSAGDDDDFVRRARSSPWLLVAIVAGGLLILAWIGWAIYVMSENGARAGLGVLIAWPAILVALALVSLPFIGIYLLLRYLSGSGRDEDVGAPSHASGEAESEATATKG
jgi:ABC-type sulfate transport system permease subunit